MKGAEWAFFVALLLAGCASSTEPLTFDDAKAQLVGDLGPEGRINSASLSFHVDLGSDEIHSNATIAFHADETFTLVVTDLRTYNEDASNIYDSDATIVVECTTEAVTVTSTIPENPEYGGVETYANGAGRCVGLTTENEFDALLIPLLGEEYGDVASPAIDALVRVPSLAFEAIGERDDGSFDVQLTRQNSTGQGVMRVTEEGVESIRVEFEEGFVKGYLHFRFEYGARSG